MSDLIVVGFKGEDIALARAGGAPEDGAAGGERLRTATAQRSHDGTLLRPTGRG